MKAKLIVAMALLLGMLMGLVAHAETAMEHVWQDGRLTGSLIRVDDAGNRVYLVSLADEVPGIDGATMTARDYACVLLLTEPNAHVRLISDTELELTVGADFVLPEGLVPIAPETLGLEVLEDENGAYLVGDSVLALSLLADIWDTETLSDSPVPLSDGSDEAEPENAPEPPKPEKKEKPAPEIEPENAAESKLETKEKPAPESEPENAPEPKPETKENQAPEGEPVKQDEPPTETASPAPEPKETEVQEKPTESSEDPEPTPTADATEPEVIEQEPTPVPEEAAQYVPVLKLSNPGRTIRVGKTFFVEVSGLAGISYMKLPDGIAFDEGLNLKDGARNRDNLSYSQSGNGTVYIAPDSPEATYYILLTAESAGRFELQLSDELSGERVGKRLRVRVETVGAEDADETDGGEVITEGAADVTGDGDEVETKDNVDVTENGDEAETEDNVDVTEGGDEGAIEGTVDATKDGHGNSDIDAGIEEEHFVPVIKLAVSCEGDELKVGTKVTIVAEITDIPEGVKYSLQWENDLSGEFMDVPGETGPSVSFYADEQNVNCVWRVRLTPLV